MIAAVVLHFWYILSDTDLFSYFRVEVVSIYACVILIIKVETGRVDAQRLCVTGESAGGFTTLACLAFRQIFKAGSSLYGASLRFP